ncbi:hypothetical protein CPB86DRAFT_759852 [Serendipita vermifera]|nr:hypothetical protein CPB86DRAFT_759852 [Serendipita vermifera]
MNMDTSELSTKGQTLMSPDQHGLQTPTTLPTTTKANRLATAVESGILIAKAAKDAADMSPLLGPLKTSMETLVALLEKVQATKRNKENWTALVDRVQNQIKYITEQLQTLEGNEDLNELVDTYRVGLDRILHKMDSAVESHQRKFGAIFLSSQAAEELRAADRGIKDCFDKFLTGLSMQTHENVKGLQKKVTRIHEDVQDNQRDVETKHQDQIDQLTTMDEINLIKGMATSSLANGDLHQPCMDGTRVNILKKIRKWFTEPNSRQILWLNDVAGAGKSTVARQMSKEWKKDNRLAGSFFFSRDAEETRTSKLFFSTVAQQGLSHLGPAIQTALANGIRKLRDPISATLEEQCLEIFIRPLQELRSSAVLVFDALDECDPEMIQRLFSILVPLVSKLIHVKLFLTSRPETYLRELFQNFNPQKLSLRTDVLSNTQDVEHYARERLKRLSIEDDTILKLIEQSNGLFIWVSTVCDLLKSLRGNRKPLIDRLLSQSNPKMDSIYRIALDQSIGNNPLKEVLEAYINVLKVIVAAYEPVSPRTIDTFLGITDSMEIVGDLRCVLECRSKDHAIRFLHPTFRDFLLDLDVSGPYYLELESAHHLMGDRCLDIMHKELDYDTTNNDRRPDLDVVSEDDLRRISRALRYSCNFWGSHITPEISNQPIFYDLSIQIESFFANNLLNWIYVVNLFDFNEKALSMLRKLSSANIVSSSSHL